MSAPRAPGRAVYLASPLSGDIETNQAYARLAMSDSLARGEAPLPPHILYTQVLNDTVPADREAGMRAGTAWLLRADALVAYIDRGVSRGMQAEIDTALAHGVPVEERRLPARVTAAADVERVHGPEVAAAARAHVRYERSRRGAR